MLFSEAGEGTSPYGIGHHRHMPEIEQELSKASGQAITVGFTPHLVPMSRGELLTCHVRLAENVSTADDVRAGLAARYADEPFVLVLDEGQIPKTQNVRGSNMVHIGVFKDRLAGPGDHHRSARQSGEGIGRSGAAERQHRVRL
jgi:N-acetyl-gamma-glutamyl-phosphate reductase